ncbi:hypothetical protein [Streptomyces gardneri]|uniref:hypothetical protein n=1 Tax=Streptomyces gardneri TaxID=66892 RepID=UPI0033EBA122
MSCSRTLTGLCNLLSAAQRTFRPSRPGLVDDREVRKLPYWRTGLGHLAWLGLMLSYKAVATADDVQGVADDDQSWTSVLVLVCTFPVVVGAFVAAARDGLRRVYLPRALRPLGSVLAIMASMGTSALAMAPESAGFRDAVGLPGRVVVIALFVWSIGFASTASDCRGCTCSAPPTSTRCCHRSSPASWCGRWPSWM